MSLLSIAQEYYDIFDDMEFDENGELVGLDRIDDLNHEFGTKAENTAQYIKELLYEAEAIKQEEAKLYQRRKAAENKAARLKEYLTFCFNVVGQDRLSTPAVKISFKPSTAVEVKSVADLPDVYKRVKTTVEADKTKIKDAIEAGEEVPGAYLVKKNNIQIK